MLTKPVAKCVYEEDDNGVRINVLEIKKNTHGKCRTDRNNLAKVLI